MFSDEIDHRCGLARAWGSFRLCGRVALGLQELEGNLAKERERMREMEGQLEWAQDYAEVQIEVTGVLPLIVLSLHSDCTFTALSHCTLSTGTNLYSLV